MGWRFEEQVERLFEGFQLREDGIDWIIEHHVRGQDHTAAIQKRHSIQNQADRARHLYLAGEIDWRSFTVASITTTLRQIGWLVSGNCIGKRMGAKLSCKLAYSREAIPKSPFMPTVVVILGAKPRSNW